MWRSILIRKLYNGITFTNVFISQFESRNGMDERHKKCTVKKSRKRKIAYTNTSTNSHERFTRTDNHSISFPLCPFFVLFFLNFVGLCECCFFYIKKHSSSQSRSENKKKITVEPLCYYIDEGELKPRTNSERITTMRKRRERYRLKTE